MKKTLIALITASTLLGGCATITDGSTQSITFTSEPPGATVYNRDGSLGETPLTIPVKRRSTGVFTVKLDGYQDSIVMLDKEVNTETYKNAYGVVFGQIGLGIDAISGADMKFTRNEVHIVLTPNN